MISLKTEYPFIEQNGVANYKMIKYYAEDEKGIRYKVQNEQTNKILEEAVCVYPTHFTYRWIKERCEKQPAVALERITKKKFVSRETKDAEPEIVEKEIVKEKEGDKEE